MTLGGWRSAAAETEEERRGIFVYLYRRRKMDFSKRPAPRTDGVKPEKRFGFLEFILEDFFFIILRPSAQLGPSRLSAFWFSFARGAAASVSGHMNLGRLDRGPVGYSRGVGG